MRRLLVLLALLTGAALFTSGTAHASASTPGQRLLAAAETRAGDWYSYGSAGPSTFDCSGLVMWAARQAGITLPHNAAAMLGSPHLVRTYHPVAGDLAFFGTGHVGIVQRGHDTVFDIRKTGTTAGNHPWNGWWAPSAYYQVK